MSLGRRARLLNGVAFGGFVAMSFCEGLWLLHVMYVCWVDRGVMEFLS